MISDRTLFLIERAAKDLLASNYAIALTGAGISTESGIPDFRGPSGLWTINPEAEKAAYRSYSRFLSDPKGWWLARLSQTGGLRNLDKALPNSGHFALAELEQMGLLKWVITQNIDGLHEKAGTCNLIEYHGNAFKLRCIECGARCAAESFDLEKLRREDSLPPVCPECGSPLKADTVSFGEPIPSSVASRSYEEASRCDFMLICGTSAVVYPFADLPRVAWGRSAGTTAADILSPIAGGNPEHVTIVEVNAEPTPLTRERISDYLIEGQAGEILPRLVEAVKLLR
ncbi:MAG: Sir2 family NAD-dependent protein deacetylase [Dehalococcoidia bacterium]|nr:Sir2 family NAD-dependent protein deacetylase [Dehalococcoidia bacterium]